MPYSQLLADGRIHVEPAARRQVRAQLRGARRDLAAAERLGPTEIWAYNIAYNAMLLAGRGVMFSDGFRPTPGEGGHAAVIEFLRIRVDRSFSPLQDTMDRMRRQRHRIAYDAEDAVSSTQVAEALRTAADFVRSIEQVLFPRRNPDAS